MTATTAAATPARHRHYISNRAWETIAPDLIRDAALALPSSPAQGIVDLLLGDIPTLGAIVVKHDMVGR